MMFLPTKVYQELRLHEQRANTVYHFRCTGGRIMPIVKATIEGREYSFAPLLFGEIKRLRKAKLSRVDLIESFDLWQPFIESSMTRAGNEMPDLDVLEIQAADVAFAALIRGVMEASGIKVASPGEAQPVPETIGMTSSGS